jgi:hypothetical protein
VKKILLMAITSGFTAAPALHAQETAPQATTPAPTAPSSPAAAVTPGEVQKFAKAVADLGKIQKDPAIAEADKQSRMAAAVQAQGLEPGRFNEIAQAAQGDPALQQQIRAAMTSTN